ncbi:MAG: hypothetical protein ACRC1P_05635 [Cellulosilyticaceae bacterium]
MHNSRYLIKLVKYFLPQRAEILQVGEDYKVFAILETDLDGDNSEEVLAVYSREGNHYLMLLKAFDRKWYVIWNSRLSYRKIDKVAVARLQEEGCQIILGGCLEGENQSSLTLFNWRQDNLELIEEEIIKYDKVYIEDVDGEDGLDEIVVWRHKYLEAYDIDIYRYTPNGLIRDFSLDKYYFKTIINYYEYLCENYEEEEIYKIYLEQAKERCSGEYKKIETRRDEVESDDKQEELIATVGYIRSSEQEENIYLWGERCGEKYISDLKLIVSNQNQRRYEVIPISQELVNEYKVFIGDFTGNGLEDIWVESNQADGERGKLVCIYSFQREGIKQIFNSREWEEEGCCIEICPVDCAMSMQYEVWYIQLILNQRIMTRARWWQGKITPYIEYELFQR